MRRIFTAVFLLIGLFVYTQPTNDICDFATFLPNTSDFCSDGYKHSNVGASPDPVFPNSCISLNFQNGVWFSFVAKQPGIRINVFGQDDKGGTMKNPKILLFDECNKFVECSPGRGVSIDEFLYDKLTLGQIYYIMIESSQGGEGSFKICIDGFVPVAAPESDCDNAVVLCDKTPFVVASLEGAGNNTKEIEPSSCIQTEFQSSWYKWTCDKPGSLSFTLTPNNVQSTETDDLDFAVYELPDGLDNCNSKRLIRCEAAGENVGQPFSNWARCNGPTGLSETETDTNEEPGCDANNNNFVSALSMVAGRSYVLIVNNFSRSGLGFSINFGGTGTFLGPMADYEVTSLDRFECDKTIMFTNKSQSLTDSIIDYQWSFGVGANPPNSNIKDPDDVSYKSFGTKTTALTIKSLRGCTVTKLLEFFVNPCCADTSTLNVTALVKDIDCNGFNTGEIQGIGRNGSPKYSFSLDSINYQPNPRFTDLEAGEYDLYIQDLKGCKFKTKAFITEPPPVIADAGEDIEVELGESSTLNGSYIPGTGQGTPLWSPKDSIRDVNSFFTEFVPLKDKAYTLLVTDENGCTDTDIVNVRVKIVRPVYAPNIISNSNPGQNGVFSLYGGKAVKSVKKLEVYDRWGSKMYEGTDLDINNFEEGWKGDINGRKVAPGVYTWIAIVLFIDDVELAFSGDVTVIE